MAYHFRNLVFEGGGVKGIAYVGAMHVLEQKKILRDIVRVGGTSAGAINATLFALGFTNAETEKILRKMDFRSFLDEEWGLLRDSSRLINRFGWYKGDYFHQWISKRVKEKLGNPDATFLDLAAAGRPHLYVYGTNLSTRFSEVFSPEPEHKPTTRIADAVRISMSIPLFFAAVRNARGDVYVDGGLLDNYPVKLFDRDKYVDEADRASMAVETEYYEKDNRAFLKKHPGRSRYVYNRQTLGFRLDTKEEIAMFRYGAEPVRTAIDDFFDYGGALLGTILDAQSNQHLHSDDWERTIYIDTLGVGTTEFDLSDAKKNKLKASGRKGTLEYFDWFDDEKNAPANRPE